MSAKSWLQWPQCVMDHLHEVGLKAEHLIKVLCCLAPRVHLTAFEKSSWSSSQSSVEEVWDSNLSPVSVWTGVVKSKHSSSQRNTTI